MVANAKGTMTWPYKIGLPEDRAKELAEKCIGYIPGYRDARLRRTDAAFLANAKQEVLRAFPELTVSPEIQNLRMTSFTLSLQRHTKVSRNTRTVLKTAGFVDRTLALNGRKRGPQKSEIWCELYHKLEEKGALSAATQTLVGQANKGPRMAVQMKRRHTLMAGLTPEQDLLLTKLHKEKLAEARRLNEIRREETKRGEILPLENPVDRDMFIADAPAQLAAVMRYLGLKGGMTVTAIIGSVNSKGQKGIHGIHHGTDLLGRSFSDYYGSTYATNLVRPFYSFVGDCSLNTTTDSTAEPMIRESMAEDFFEPDADDAMEVDQNPIAQVQMTNGVDNGMEVDVDNETCENMGMNVDGPGSGVFGNEHWQGSDVQGHADFEWQASQYPVYADSEVQQGQQANSFADVALGLPFPFIQDQQMSQMQQQYQTYQQVHPTWNTIDLAGVSMSEGVQGAGFHFPQTSTRNSSPLPLSKDSCLAGANTFPTLPQTRSSSPTSSEPPVTPIEVSPSSIHSPSPASPEPALNSNLVQENVDEAASGAVLRKSSRNRQAPQVFTYDGSDAVYVRT
ncbi:hypothetical protein C8J56DRAFT_1067456 [Mycena floridula]|nr:hypothetical protein C8J56DRAFT_1067456 [Mycena floridula]